jgi:hypothetical protein
MKLDLEECDVWILMLKIAFVVSDVWGNGAPVNVESTTGRVQQVGALSGNCFPLHATRSKFILDSAERLRYVLLP